MTKKDRNDWQKWWYFTGRRVRESAWELRWWSFTRNDGGTVWVYHARSKSTGQRYISFTNHADGKLQQWEITR